VAPSEKDGLAAAFPVPPRVVDISVFLFRTVTAAATISGDVHQRCRVKIAAIFPRVGSVKRRAVGGSGTREPLETEESRWVATLLLGLANRQRWQW